MKKVKAMKNDLNVDSTAILSHISAVFPKFRLGHRIDDDYSPIPIQSLSKSLGTLKVRK